MLRGCLDRMDARHGPIGALLVLMSWSLLGNCCFRLSRGDPTRKPNLNATPFRHHQGESGHEGSGVQPCDANTNGI